MSSQRSYLEDVIKVIYEIKKAHSQREFEKDYSKLRKEAIKTVAEQEIGRFKNIISAQKTIFDACSRRLIASGSIKVFDHAVEQWLSGNPEPMKSIMFQKTDAYQKKEIETIIDSHIISLSTESVEETVEPTQFTTEINRIIRNTSLTVEIKRLYKYTCQLCNMILIIANGKPYAEAHHIKPLGNGHNGPDVRDNLICVCPNCHVLLDYGGIKIDSKQLNLTSKHKISNDHINYHNENIFNQIVTEC